MVSFDLCLHNNNLRLVLMAVFSSDSDGRRVSLAKVLKLDSVKLWQKGSLAKVWEVSCKS